MSFWDKPLAFGIPFRALFEPRLDDPELAKKRVSAAKELFEPLSFTCT